MHVNTEDSEYVVQQGVRTCLSAQSVLLPLLMIRT